MCSDFEKNNNTKTNPNCIEVGAKKSVCCVRVVLFDQRGVINRGPAGTNPNKNLRTFSLNHGKERKEKYNT